MDSKAQTWNKTHIFLVSELILLLFQALSLLHDPYISPDSEDCSILSNMGCSDTQINVAYTCIFSILTTDIDILGKNVFFLINKVTMVLSKIFQTVKYLVG